MTSYSTSIESLEWSYWGGRLPLDGIQGDVGLPQMESTLQPSTCCWFRLAIPWWSLKRSWATLESTEELGYLGLHPHCSHLHAAVSIRLPPDGIYKGDGVPRMKPIEELGYPGWNLYCSHVHAAVSIGLAPDRFYREMGHPGLNQDWNQDLLPWMEWASAEDIVTVHFIIIYGHFVILFDVIFIVLNYNPVTFPLKTLPKSIWETFLRISDFYSNSSTVESSSSGEMGFLLMNLSKPDSWLPY
jgi:hypothetical protein